MRLADRRLVQLRSVIDSEKSIGMNLQGTFHGKLNWLCSMVPIMVSGGDEERARKECCATSRSQN